MGSAAVGAAAGLELLLAVPIAAVGPAAPAIAAVVNGHSGSLILSGVAVSLSGLVIGGGRRVNAERVRQDMRVAVEHERAELEHARADVLGERNRLAREMQDVLAHTLGALAV